MATSVTDLSITKATVNVGSAATFRQTINDNFTNYKNSIETKVNSQIKPAITELQNKVGEWNTSNYGTITAFVGSWPTSFGTLTNLIGSSWPIDAYGSITNRLGGAVTGKRVLVGDEDDARSVAQIGDVICEVYTV